MAVKDDFGVLPKPAQKWNTGRKLIDEEDRRFQLRELPAPGDSGEQVDLSEDRKEDFEAAEYGGREEAVTADTDVQRPISSLAEAMVGIAMGREDGDFGSSLLQADGGIDHKTFGAAYS